MALVEQKNGAYQGQANYQLYKIAAQQTPTACNSSTETNPTQATACIFHDVTTGSNALSCPLGGLNCTVSIAGSTQFGDLSGYSATQGYDLATGLGTVSALASTSQANGSVLVSIAADKGIYVVAEMPDGSTVAPFLLDTTPTTAVSLTTLPNGDLRQESIQGGQLVERTLTSDGWGAKTLLSPMTGLTGVATTTLRNGNQLVDVLDQNGRVYELTHWAAGYINGPAILNENTGATSVALTARPDGGAVQEVVRNHQLLERIQHNGAWGGETPLN